MNTPAEQQKGDRKGKATRVREAGKSLLPIARVQRIVKADKDIPIVTKEAIFLISMAAEEFIKRLSEASQRVADREHRLTVAQRDIATVIRQDDEFAFLDEIIMWTATSMATTKRKETAVGEAAPKAATFLDKYVIGSGTDVAGEDTMSSQ